MKIELKNFKYYSGMSEETNAFKADVFINGQKAAYANNTGHGGCTNVRPYEGGRKLLDDAEEWSKTQKDFEGALFHAFDCMIDEMVLDLLIERGFKKLLKKPTLLHSDGRMVQSKGASLDDKTINAYSQKGFKHINAMPRAEALGFYRSIVGA